MHLKNETNEAVEGKSIFPPKIRIEASWDEFLGNCRKAETYGERLGLLHRGFDVPTHSREEEIAKLSFYFFEAENWRNSFLHENTTDNGGMTYIAGYDEDGIAIKKSPADLRREIAKKAFDMLSLNLFKKIALKGIGHYHVVLFSEKLFPVIQSFFRIDEGGTIHNLRYSKSNRSHNENLAVDFLVAMAKVIWSEENEDAQFNQIAKPWAIEILTALNQLEVLHPWLFSLDKATLEKLQEIALRSRLEKYSAPVTEDRLVNSVEEAFFLDSPAARFLIEYRIKKEVRKKLRKVFSAEQAIKGLQKRIKDS